MYLFKESTDLHFREQQLNHGKFDCQSIFCWRFIIYLLLQHKFQDINLINRRWRARRKKIWITPIRYAGATWSRFLIEPPIFDWSVVKWKSKDQNHKDSCLKEIELCLRIFLTTPHSIKNTNRRTYVFN